MQPQCTCNSHSSNSTKFAANYDPTRTLTLRDQFSREMTKRFVELRGAIRQSIVDEDAFGLTPGARTINTLQIKKVTTPGRNAFAFPRSSDKVNAFMDWLRHQEEIGLLETKTGQALRGIGSEMWTDKFIQSAYQRGVSSARSKLRRAGYKVPTLGETGGIGVAMNQPFHAERVALLFTRTFNDLKGINDAMSGQISRVLAQAMADGKGSREIARLLTRTITGPSGDLGLTDTLGRFIPAQRRARMLARTEIIRAHSDATLTEFKAWGVQGVTVIAEFVTAGDDRVCVSKYNQVLTDKGYKPIQEIKIGDKALTRAGYKKVINIGNRRTIERMVKLKVEGKSLQCTASHRIWTESRGFVKAESLLVDELVQLPGNKLVNVLGVVDLGFCNSNNIPSFGLKKLIAPFISLCGNFMPIIPINFNCNFANSKVNGISSNLNLLPKNNFLSLKGLSNDSFKAGFTSKFSVTSQRTKSPLFSTWDNSKIDTACKALNNFWRSSAFFGTISDIKPTVFVGATVKKLFAATKAVAITAPLGYFTAFHRTISISICNRLFYNKAFIATRAKLSNRMPTARIITSAAAKRPTFGSGCKKILAMGARPWMHLPLIFRIACMRTISFFRATFFFNSFIVFFKSFTTKGTDKVKGHFYSLLSALYLLYHKLSGIQPFVYDLTIEDQPEFYANGILVHNCAECESLEGQTFTIAEAEGLIPVHVNCRCTWLPKDVTKS